MSSACVCHIEGDFCFYCEIYSPLEDKHERQTWAIERVIAELEARRVTVNNDSIRALNEVNNQDVMFLGTLYRGWYQGMGMAIDKLKEVIASDVPTSNRQTSTGSTDDTTK